MKNLLTAFALLVTSTTADAQLQKGNLMVGGTGSFTIGNNANPYAGVYLEPRIGMFLTDRLVMGSGVGLGYYAFVSPFEGRLHSYGASLRPYVRYYLTKSAPLGEVPKGLRPFAEVGGSLIAERFNGHISTGATGYVGLGVNKFLNKHVALEAQIDYTISPEFYSFGGFGSRGFGGKFGFQIFLDRSKQKANQT